MSNPCPPSSLQCPALHTPSACTGPAHSSPIVQGTTGSSDRGYCCGKCVMQIISFAMYMHAQVQSFSFPSLQQSPPSQQPSERSDLLEPFASISQAVPALTTPDCVSALASCPHPPSLPSYPPARGLHRPTTLFTDCSRHHRLKRPGIPWGQLRPADHCL